MQLITDKARAYVYAGNWVAECTRTECGGVEYLYALMTPRDPTSPRTVEKPVFHCTNCDMTAAIDWPSNRMEILAELMRRPVPETRNWYPANHDVAVRAHLPHGQSVAELREESAAHGVGV